MIAYIFEAMETPEFWVGGAFFYAVLGLGMLAVAIADYAGNKRWPQGGGW